jgi:hypothetical protein
MNEDDDFNDMLAMKQMDGEQPGELIHKTTWMSELALIHLRNNRSKLQLADGELDAFEAELRRRTRLQLARPSRDAILTDALVAS